MDHFLENFFTYSFSLLPMIAIGCYGYFRLNWFYRLCLLQAFAALILYAIDARNPGEDNHIRLNVYLVFEYALLMAAAATLLTTRTERTWIIGAFILFVVTFLSDLIWLHEGLLAAYSVAVGAIPVLAIFLVLVYRYAQDRAVRTTIWLWLGVVIYFCGIAPVLTLSKYVLDNYPSLHSILFSYNVAILGHIRYLLAGFSFWLFLREQRRLPTDTRWPKARSY